MKFKIPYLLLIILFPVLFLSRPSAYGMPDDFVFLNSYLADEPASLGAGLFDNPPHNATDPYRPTRLIGQPASLSFHYRDENVINKINGDWENTNIGSLTRETRGIFSRTLPILHESAFAFSSKNFAFHADVDTDSHNTIVTSAQDYDSTAISFSATPLKFLKLGVGLEKQSGQNEFFYDLSVTPGPGLTVGGRQFKRTMAIENTLWKDGYLANYIYNYQKTVTEFSVNISAPELLEINTIIADTDENSSIYFRVATKHLIASYNLFDRRSYFFNQIIINDQPGGHLHGRLDYSGQALTFEIPSGKTRYFPGLKESLVDLSGAGKVSGAYILDFWQDLLAGDRYFNYALKTRTTQYQLGLENRTTNKLTTRFGLQYLIIKPDATLDDWTPIPFINIGRLDEENLALEYSKFTLGLISFGFSYRVGRLEVAYGFGQFIPIETVKKEDPASPAAGGDSGGDGSSVGGVSNLADHIRHNPGGNLQSLTVAWYF